MYELLTSKEIQIDISSKIKLLRLKLNRTQDSFAKSIGISKTTYMRFENTGEGSFESFIRIMQGIGRISELENLVKVENFSPLEAMKNTKKKPPRQRASTSNENDTPSVRPSKVEKSFLDKIKESKNG
jgi:DNA-binding XRE family transcriptional regulator